MKQQLAEAKCSPLATAQMPKPQRQRQCPLVLGEEAVHLKVLALVQKQTPAEPSVREKKVELGLDSKATRQWARQV
jgi:hypothetical protein